MRSYLIIICTLVFAISACKKDVIKKEEGIPFPQGWFASQNVKINKVEFKRDFGGYFLGSDSTFYFEYKYDTLGRIYEIKLKSYEFLEFEKSYNISYIANTNKFIFQNNFPPCLNSNFYKMEYLNNEFEFFDNKLSKINGIFISCGFGIPSTNENKRIASFSYNEDGLLKSIYSNNDFWVSGRLGTDIDNILYDESNAVKSLELISHYFDSKENTFEAENFVINFDYQPANDVPDGLRRIVNQSILELNSLGYEEYFFQQLIESSGSSKREYTEWFSSFGIQQLQTISSQNIGLISTKHLKGNRVNSYDELTSLPIFTQVDSTANFPYIHDASAKTLEIAGLKIYYELVE